MDLFLIGLLSSLIVGLATGAGAIPLFFVKRISDKLLDVLLGFSAGVMLAATCFSLIVPAINLSGPLLVVVGVALGALTLHLIDRFVPHFHPASGPEGPSLRLPKVWLFVVAITIHNFPEGLAVGMSFGNGDVAAGVAVALAIGLQNMPEGLAVALPLMREGYTRGKSLVCHFDGVGGAFRGLAGFSIGFHVSAYSTLGASFCRRRHAVCGKR